MRILNAHLDALQSKVFEIYKTLLQKEAPISAEIIKARMLGKIEKPQMLLDIFKEHNQQIKALVGHGYAPLTYKRYTTALGHTRSFIKWKYRASDFEITRLSYEFIADFDFTSAV